ncbi:PREDICTED: uncharacterized protein LOC106338760 [Brassica oleracea var. oleracea]|uniref:uncharacterized protein LOC106338760 n=1 Tax=Brassica oleracea var. oleracea TaxID=109376 RepID=UPI0006A7358F|nr:PREDICTED: uncharacterized protein LOC106338760 [Brassica oleracea var. oleracea]
MKLEATSRKLKLKLDQKEHCQMVVRERESSPGVLAGATARQDVVKLVITINRSSRPSSCSSRQDEAVDTNRVTIGARTKPYAPPEVSPPRAREFHAPPPDHRPPPQRRRRTTVLRRSSAVAAGQLTGKPPP